MPRRRYTYHPCSQYLTWNSGPESRSNIFPPDGHKTVCAPSRVGRAAAQPAQQRPCWRRDMPVDAAGLDIARVRTRWSIATAMLATRRWIWDWLGHRTIEKQLTSDIANYCNKVDMELRHHNMCCARVCAAADPADVCCVPPDRCKHPSSQQV